MSNCLHTKFYSGSAVLECKGNRQTNRQTDTQTVTLAFIILSMDVDKATSRYFLTKDDNILIYMNIVSQRSQHLA